MGNFIEITEIIKMRKVILDSSFILSPAFLYFLRKCDSICKEQHKSLFIPSFEYDLVDKSLLNSDPFLQRHAQIAMRAIKAMEQTGTVKILKRCKGGTSDDYKDFFEKYADMKYFSVVVQSKEKKVLESARKAGLKHYQIELLQTDTDGNVIDKKSFYNGARNTGNIKHKSYESRKEYGYVRDDEKFVLCNQFARIQIKKIIPMSNIRTGSTVYRSNGIAVCIGNKKLINTESSTYETNQYGMWAKIYNPEHLNTYYEQKIDLMLSHKIDYDGICWPKDKLFDSQNNFIGVLVPMVNGNPLHLSIFKQAGIQENFPKWNKTDLCRLTITILKKIQYLHERNVLFGCINPASIFVENSEKVYFTDTDCYQIEGFPCFQHNINFTAPELQNKNNKLYLATKQNEYFGVAVLVFMLMMPGKPPYMGKHPGDASKEIIKMQFPYSNRTIRGNDVPPGVWRFVWSHLTPFKDPFYQTFQKEGKFAMPEKRREARFWTRVTEDFLKELEDKNTYDKESIKMFPASFKRSSKEEFYRCNYCEVEHPRFFFYNEYFDRHRICKSCISKRSNVYYICQACGKTYYYTNKAAIYHRDKENAGEWKKQKYCKDCKERTAVCSVCGTSHPTYKMKKGMCLECYNRAVYVRVRCKECGRDFTITNGEYEHMTAKGLHLPKRCEKCRKNRY